MRHRFILSVALALLASCAWLCLGNSVAWAQVKILSPADGATVYGIVTVQASKPDPNDGWISFRVTPADQKFLVAVTTPFTFDWNSAERNDKGQQVYPDGDYTLEAAAYDGAGKQQGNATITVHVKNTIDANVFGQQVLLRANYERADVFLYQMTGSQVVDVPDPAGSKLRNPPEMTAGGPGGMGGGAMPGMAPGMPPMMGGGMGMGMGGGMGGGMGMGANVVGVPSTVRIRSDASWTLEVLTPSATGRAVVDQDLQRGYFLVTWVWPKKMNEKTMKLDSNVPDKFSGWLPGNLTQRPTEGHFYRFKVLANGKFEEMHKDSPSFPMGQFYTELPTDPVKTGDTWSGKMAMITGLTDSEASLMQASFKLEGFEYRGRYRCARISATHTETGVEIPWDLPGAPASGTGLGGAAGAPGMMGGMGPGGGAIAPGAMSGLPSAMGGMGMGGQPMTGPNGEPLGTLKGDVTIKRVAYFAVDEGRFVAFEDTVNKKITKILAPEVQTGMGMGGGMGMPGGMGGMGTGGMMEMKPLEFRGLNHIDATGLMGSLVGAGGGMMGGGMGGTMGGPGGMLGGLMGAVTGYAGALNTAMAGGVPKMPPGGGMMPPGGAPGMGPGMGMAQMEPPTPAVINIDTTLNVEEVRQIAGHGLARRANL